MLKFSLLSAIMLAASILSASTAPTMISDVAATSHDSHLHRRSGKADVAVKPEVQRPPVNYLRDALEKTFENIADGLRPELTSDPVRLEPDEKKLLEGKQTLWSELRRVVKGLDSDGYPFMYFDNSKATLRRRMARFRVPETLKTVEGQPPRPKEEETVPAWLARLNSELEEWNQESEDAREAYRAMRYPEKKTLGKSVFETVAPKLAAKKADAEVLKARTRMANAETMIERVTAHIALAEWMQPQMENLLKL